MSPSPGIDPAGYTYAHEHLFIDLSLFKHDSDCRLDEFELLCSEMNQLMTRGVRNIIEVTNHYMGRNVEFVSQIIDKTGINVLFSTGYYQQCFYPEHVFNMNAQQLAAEMIKEIEHGIADSGIKASVIGEIGSSEGCITPDEEKMFHAAALTWHQTGRPISTHTGFSTMGPEQLALLKNWGVPGESIVIGHCDLKDDIDTLLHLIDEGAYIQFDTIGKNSYFPDKHRVRLLTELSARGLLNRVMLSMDITRKSHLRSNGGLGYCYLMDSFVPELIRAGINQAEIEQMLKYNPASFFKS